MGAALDRADSMDEVAEPLSHALAERDQLLLLVWAEAEYFGRRKRTAFVAEDLLGEPCWDILLDLYIQEARRRRVTVKSACKASAVPDTTALRWLSILEGRGLINREGALYDKRVQFVELSAEGKLAVSRWLRYRAAFPVY